MLYQQGCIRVKVWLQGILRERLEPGGNGLTELIRRVLLKKVKPTHGDFGLLGPAPAELALSSSERGSRVSIHEEFWDRAL
jgi:hypothetical protein